MAHFAQINESYVVIQVVVLNNEIIDNLPFPESEPIGVAFCQSLFGNTTAWKQASYNSNFRKHYPSPDYFYDLVLDAFIPPQPGPDWVLNVETCLWELPPKTDPVMDGMPPEVI